MIQRGQEFCASIAMSIGSARIAVEARDEGTRGRTTRISKDTFAPYVNSISIFTAGCQEEL